MGNKTSGLVVKDTLIRSQFATEYFLPSADYDYPVCDFLKDNGCGVDDGYAEVLVATKSPAVEEGPYLVTDLLFDRPLVSHTCLFAESSFLFFYAIAFRKSFFCAPLSDLPILCVVPTSSEILRAHAKLSL